MKIFVTSSSWNQAKTLAAILKSLDHEVTSDWHNRPYFPTASYDEPMRELIATDARKLIEKSDALVVFSTDEPVPGGKFVDVGIALGSGKKVFLIGHRENLKMWDSAIRAFGSVNEFLEFISG